MFAQTKQKGFTLLEIVLVIIILGIILAGVSDILMLGFRSFITGQNIVNANWQGMVTIERMTRDLSTIRSSSDISVANAGNLTFIDINGNSINYNITGTQLKRNTQVLTDDVQGLTFNYFDRNGAAPATTADIRYITAALTLKYHKTTITLTTGVYPWNVL